MTTTQKNFTACFILSLCFIFKASAFQNFVTVSGKIDQHSEEEISVNLLDAVLDEEGRFSLEVPVEENENLSFYYRDFKLGLFAEPGDSIQIYFNAHNPAKTVDFGGKNASIQAFLFDQQQVSKSFNAYFNRNINRVLARLPEAEFVQKTDSLKMTFLDPLDDLEKKEPNLNPAFVNNYRKDLELFFLSLLADYPLLHYKTTGEKISLSEESRNRIDNIDITDLQLYRFDGFKRLLQNYLYLAINRELETGKYSASDNRRLDAGFRVIAENFSDPEMFDRVLFGFFRNHIENLGIKNTQDNYEVFMTKVSNPDYKEEIRSLYERNERDRKGHLIVPYKQINGYSLDAHIFQPVSLQKGKIYPVIAMFHGGSFFEGKPDWFFTSAKAYAKKGWVTVAVEYRVADRHGNTLPEAISDGKSLVRFLRTNAEKFQLDPNKILISGNSSGATIALALATTGEILDEKNENRQISSRPNAVIVNAGLADLREAGHWWQEDYTEEFIENISPLNNADKDLPPMLIFHGTKDNSVDIESIRKFASLSKKSGNQVTLMELEGAPHMIWRIPYFSRQMEEPKENFLSELNW
ncbi:alpha/beta hydrolase [Salinimicrobium sp. HB62]|uniref:alpha/beta hydrolase n=1 Tax=Salinimicrobium sp. HB62 TaxID=3077781 RepID=UPI002D77CEB0|nr:alpha/beta hydrolase [Salinimicrobium sp. HB62]